LEKDDRILMEALKKFEKWTPTSKRMFEEAKNYIAGGVTGDVKFFEPYPVLMRKAHGSKIEDVDGNSYVDLLCAYGAIILGHGNTITRSAMKFVEERVGTSLFGTPSPYEADFAKLLTDSQRFDGSVRFSNSGTEATVLAVRLAKAATGRKAIAKFEGHYHGSNDRLLVSHRPPLSAAGKTDSPRSVADSSDVDETALSETVVLPFNDTESTASLLEENAERLACVIMEPFEEGVIEARNGFIRKVRKLTADCGIPLIFDEVKTGFRVGLRSAAGYYNITPDIICLGKTIGGGFPIGAVMGNHHIMDQLGKNHNGRAFFHSGTFSGNPLSMIAGMKTVEYLMQHDNFRKIEEKTSKLRSGITRELESHGLEHTAEGRGTMFNYYLGSETVNCYRDVIKSNQKLRRILDLLLLTEGVYNKPLNRYSMMLSHEDDDITEVVGAMSRVLDVLQS
jgi:glutamate-1-semialdehyde 2,1-aminomutase